MESDELKYTSLNDNEIEEKPGELKRWNQRMADEKTWETVGRLNYSMLFIPPLLFENQAEKLDKKLKEAYAMMNLPPIGRTIKHLVLKLNGWYIEFMIRWIKEMGSTMGEMNKERGYLKISKTASDELGFYPITSFMDIVKDFIKPCSKNGLGNM